MKHKNKKGWKKLGKSVRDIGVQWEISNIYGMKPPG